MAINPETYAEDFTPFAAAPDFALVPGVASNTVRLWIINNLAADGTADTTEDLYLVPHQRTVGETEWRAAGRRLVDARAYRIRAVSGHGGLVVTDTATYPAGAGRPFALPVMADGEGVLLEVSIVAPIDHDEPDLEHYFAPAILATVELAKGLSAAVGDGVYLGLGDGRSTRILTAGTVDAASTPDDTVTCSGVWGWQSAGVPLTDRDRVLTFDGAAADGALAAGEAYWALIHTDAAGQLAEVRGNKGTEPVPESERPVLADPSTQSDVAYVYRGFDGLIGPEDITLASELGAGQLTAVNLNAAVGPSEGLVGDRWWSRQGREALSLAPSATSTVWRLPVGDPVATTDGTRPTPDSIALWEATTDASAITLLIRRHRWLGPQRSVTFVFDEPLVSGLTRYAVLPGHGDVYLPPLAGEITATVFDAGGGSSGASEWEISYALPGVPVAW
ncbi:MAG: hypothetical protein AAFX50_10885, partial [Acidobacteriota bacterium]